MSSCSSALIQQLKIGNASYHESVACQHASEYKQALKCGVKDKRVNKKCYTYGGHDQKKRIARKYEEEDDAADAEELNYSSEEEQEADQGILRRWWNKVRRSARRLGQRLSGRLARRERRGIVYPGRASSAIQAQEDIQVPSVRRRSSGRKSGRKSIRRSTRKSIPRPQSVALILDA